MERALTKVAVPAFVEDRLRRALTKLRLHSLVAKAVEVGTKDVPHTPRLFMPHRSQAVREALGREMGTKVVDQLSKNPDVALAAALPIPGAVPLYVAAKKVVPPLASKAGTTLRNMIKEGQVEPYQQETQYSCSAACLRAVLLHYGIDLPEKELVHRIGATPRRGAEIDQITKAAWDLGLDAFLYEFNDLDQAKFLLDLEIPIICDVQSFNHPGKGHYVVLTAIEGDRVYLMDPNTPGNERVLTRDHMDARWWDWTMVGHLLKEKWGAVVLPPEQS